MLERGKEGRRARRSRVGKGGGAPRAGTGRAWCSNPAQQRALHEAPACLLGWDRPHLPLALPSPCLRISLSVLAPPLFLPLPTLDPSDTSCSKKALSMRSLFLFSTSSTSASTGTRLRTLRIRLVTNASSASASSSAPTTCAWMGGQGVGGLWCTVGVQWFYGTFLGSGGK